MGMPRRAKASPPFVPAEIAAAEFAESLRRATDNFRLVQHVLLTVLNNEEAEASQRMAAAKMILDRGLGLPRQEVTMQVAPAPRADLSRLTDEHLAQLEQIQRLALPAGAGDDDE
jgi:hypothetical protein